MVFEYEKDAMANKPCPEGLDIADMCAYMALRNLYLVYHNRGTTREAAKEEKKKIEKDWTYQKSKLEFLDRENEKIASRIKIAFEKYAKNKTEENAQEMYNAFYNVGGNKK